jgi:hypothetical protein
MLARIIAGGEIAWVYGNARVYGNAQVYGDAWVSKSICCATRSDGYTFTVAPDKDGKLVVIAGCRYFTFKQAKAHWQETRGGTQLGDESLQILKHLKAMAKIRHGNL